MHRRHFLQNSLLGLTTLHWLGCASPKNLATEDELTLQGNTPLARAASLGKPLLILVVPEAQDEKEYRGQLYGYLASEAEDKDIALLSLCEIVCASPETLAKIAPEVTGDDWLVLLETDGSKPAHRIARLSPEPPIKSLPEMLREVLFADEAMKKRRVAQCRAVLSKNELKELSAESLRKSLGRSADCYRGAAHLLWTYEQSPPSKEAIDVIFLNQNNAYAYIQFKLSEDSPTQKPLPMPNGLLWLLSAGTISRLFNAPPEGSKWETYEQEEYPACPSCGMGSASTVSRQFLRFLTELPEAI
jgi:hypothetical protein